MMQMMYDERPDESNGEIRTSRCTPFSAFK